MTSAAISVFA